MKSAALLAAASVLLASNLLVAGVFAQSSAPANVPPPPGIHDPGTQAVAPPAAGAVAPQATNQMDLQPQNLPSMQDVGSERDGKHALPTQVTVHDEGDNSIQEYRRSGELFMVVVTPKHGVPQTYMVDPQGRVVDEHGQKPVRPVMYKVMEWGKSKPAAADSSGAAPEDGGP